MALTSLGFWVKAQKIFRAKQCLLFMVQSRDCIGMDVIDMMMYCTIDILSKTSAT